MKKKEKKRRSDFRHLCICFELSRFEWRQAEVARRFMCELGECQQPTNNYHSVLFFFAAPTKPDKARGRQKTRKKHTHTHTISNHYKRLKCEPSCVCASRKIMFNEMDMKRIKCRYIWWNVKMLVNWALQRHHDHGNCEMSAVSTRCHKFYWHWHFGMASRGQMPSKVNPLCRM